MANLTLESARKFHGEAAKAALELKATADKMKADMLASGVNLMEDSDSFNKLDEAYKMADVKADEAAVLRERLGRLAEMEAGSQHQAQPEERRPYAGNDGAGRVKSISHRVTDNADFKAFQDQLGRMVASGGEAMAFQFAASGIQNPVTLLSKDEFRALMDFQAATVTGGGATSGGPFIINDLQPGFVPYARKRPSLAALVGSGETNSDVVEYVTQSAQTDAAAETAEDTAAPESAYTFATNTTNVREITHFVPITLRAMADAGQLRTIVENELLAGAIDRLDTQIASGDGTGQNLAGIYNTSGIGTQAVGTDYRLDALHKAVTKIRVAAGVLSEPDYIGMHPNDWQTVRLEKDASDNYLLGPAGMAGEKQIWGVPVVTSTVFTAGTPLVGDFAGSARLWTREGLSLNSGLDGNDFTKRRISLLAAIRVAFAVTRAGGFTTVTGF